jgi:hypothetical protein
MKHRNALLAVIALATVTTACWAVGPIVKHDKLDISDLIEQSISVFYTNRGGNDQAFDVKSAGIVAFEAGGTRAWLLPVLNGNADVNQPLRLGHCDIFVYRENRDYVTRINMSDAPPDGAQDDKCTGFGRPLIVTETGGTSQLVIYPTVYVNQHKATAWRVLAYDAPNQSFCYAPEASASLTKAPGATSINESNAKSVLDGLHLSNDAFKCAVPTKVY